LRTGQAAEFNRNIPLEALKGLTVYKTDVFTAVTKTVSSLLQHVAALRIFRFFRDRKALAMNEFQSEIILWFAPVIGVFN